MPNRFIRWALGRIRPVRPPVPTHLARGNQGEHAAKRYLRKQGLRFLTSNFRSPRGEIDLIFRDRDCLIFVEVKTRSSEEWNRPARAVGPEKRRRLTKAAFDYLKRIRSPDVSIRFDVVEVLLENDRVREVRHLPDSFGLSPPYEFRASGAPKA